MPTLPGPTVVDSGSGFQVGSSYLFATSPSVSGVGSASSVGFPLTLLSSAGGDIEIDGGDDTIVNILTTGWYQAIGYPVFAFEGNYFVMGQAAWTSDIAGYTKMFSFDQLYVPAGTSFQQWGVTAVTPILPFSAGDTLVLGLSAFTVGNVGTWGASWTQETGDVIVSVMRFA